MTTKKILSYLRQFQLSERIFFSGGIAFLALALIDPRDALDPPVTVTFISGVILTVLAQKFPKSATLGYALLIALVSYQPSLRNALMVLWPGIFVALLALSGQKKTAWLSAFALWYFSSVSLSTGEYIPEDWVGALIVAAFLAVSVLVGSTIERVKTQQNNLKEEMEKNRDLMIRALHDSVATKLTSIILRAETLGLSPKLDNDTRLSLEFVADEARAAISDVRSLLETMKRENSISLPTSQETLEQQIIATIKLFKSHRLKVRFHNSLPRGVRRAKLPNGMQNVFAELASNILKYSDPASAIEISTRWNHDSLLIYFSNAVAAKQSPSYLTTGLGLKGIDDLIRSFGGTYTRKLNYNIWITEIEIPKKSLVMPQSG